MASLLLAACNTSGPLGVQNHAWESGGTGEQPESSAVERAVPVRLSLRDYPRSLRPDGTAGHGRPNAGDSRQQRNSDPLNMYERLRPSDAAPELPVPGGTRPNENLTAAVFPVR